MKTISFILAFIILSSATLAASVSHSVLNGSMSIISPTTGIVLAKIGDESVGGPYGILSTYKIYSSNDVIALGNLQATNGNLVVGGTASIAGGKATVDASGNLKSNSITLTDGSSITSSGGAVKISAPTSYTMTIGGYSKTYYVSTVMTGSDADSYTYLGTNYYYQYAETCNGDAYNSYTCGANENRDCTDFVMPGCPYFCVYAVHCSAKVATTSVVETGWY